MSENQTEQSAPIVQVSEGVYIKLKQVDVHADYVDANGNPLSANGAVDTGNYYLALTPDKLSALDATLLQALANGFYANNNPNGVE